MTIYKAFTDFQIHQMVDALVTAYRKQPQAKESLLVFTLRFQYHSQFGGIDENQFFTFIVQCQSSYVFVGVQDGKDFDTTAPIRCLAFHDTGWREAVEGYCRRFAGQVEEKHPNNSWDSFNSFWKNARWVPGGIRMTDEGNEASFLSPTVTKKDLFFCETTNRNYWVLNYDTKIEAVYLAAVEYVGINGGGAGDVDFLPIAKSSKFDGRKVIIYTTWVQSPQSGALRVKDFMAFIGQSQKNNE